MRGRRYHDGAAIAERDGQRFDPGQLSGSWFKIVGKQYKVPWVILAGIGKVESDDGQTTLPGVDSGSNAFGAAGPMQIGISGAAGNTWGGRPVHPASEHVNGVATDENGDGVASVYEPPDAIAGAAKYLLEHGVLTTSPARSSPTTTWTPTSRTCSAGRTSTPRAGSRSAGHRRQRAVLRPRRQLASSNYAAEASPSPRPDRQALPVWRYRPRRLRLLGPDHDVLPGGRDRHPAYRAEQWMWGPRIQRGQVSPATWCSSSAPTVPRRRPGTSAS